MLEREWGSTTIITRGQGHEALDAPAVIAETGGQALGLATYRISEGECELLTIDSLQSGAGVGSALLEAVRRQASAAGCSRIWLVTTNDNTPALRFY